VYVRSSFTVVNLHDSWSSYPRSIWHVIGLVYEKWGNLGASPNSKGHGPRVLPVEASLGYWGCSPNSICKSAQTILSRII